MIKCDPIHTPSSVVTQQVLVSFYGDVAFLSCGPLYSGDARQWTCTSEGTWDGAMPQCEGI